MSSHHIHSYGYSGSATVALLYHMIITLELAGAALSSTLIRYWRRQDQVGGNLCRGKHSVVVRVQLLELSLRRS